MLTPASARVPESPAMIPTWLKSSGPFTMISRQSRSHFASRGARASAMMMETSSFDRVTEKNSAGGACAQTGSGALLSERQIATRSLSRLSGTIARFGDDLLLSSPSLAGALGLHAGMVMLTLSTHDQSNRICMYT